MFEVSAFPPPCLRFHSIVTFRQRFTSLCQPTRMSSRSIVPSKPPPTSFYFSNTFPARTSFISWNSHAIITNQNPTPPSSDESHTPPTPNLLSSLNPDQLLSRTRLRLISSMFSQMCQAVAVCHAVNVFHRDIKPEKFIVTGGLVGSPGGRQEHGVVVRLTGLAHLPTTSSLPNGLRVRAIYELVCVLEHLHPVVH